MTNPAALPPLALPPMPLRIRSRTDGQTDIFDPLRSRYVRLTPEEWVRQHFCHYLIAHLGYPPVLLANEISLRIGGGAIRRADTVLYHRDGSSPQMIVEYKAPTIPLSLRVVDQVASYNRILDADYYVISNGLTHYAFRIIRASENNATAHPEPLSAIPQYDALLFTC